VGRAVKNYFKTNRGNVGVGERVKEETIAEGQSSGWEAVADWVIARYDVRVRARLAAMGLEVDGEGPITVDAIREAVQAKSGLQIDELTPEGITEAVNKKLASELSAVLGFEVSTVFDSEALKSEVKEQVLQALAGGHGAGIIAGDTLEELKAAATFARAGLVGDEKRKAQARYRQKKYRRTHSQIWQ
jgi:hypothetical protein